MPEIKIIEKDWPTKIEAYVDAITAELTRTKAADPFAKREECKTFAAICGDFLSHLETHFGSTQGFCDFLQSQVRQAFSQVGLDPRFIEEYASWEIPNTDDNTRALIVSSLYKYDYVELMERAAHKKAYHHAVPMFDLTL